MPDSSIPPEIPKQSAVGTWAVLGLLAVALVGGAGFAFTKLSAGGGEIEKPATAPVAPTSTSLANVGPAIPPPPPPPPPPAPLASEPAPSASASAAAAHGSKPHSASSGKPQGPRAGGRCESPCEGETDRTFEAALRQQGQLARRCYDLALLQNSALQGKLTVAVRVGTDGRSCGAKIVSDGLGNPAVNACVTKIFETASYPLPRGGCADGQVPLNFVPKQ